MLTNAAVSIYNYYFNNILTFSLNISNAADMLLCINYVKNFCKEHNRYCNGSTCVIFFLKGTKIFAIKIKDISY